MREVRNDAVEFDAGRNQWVRQDQRLPCVLEPGVLRCVMADVARQEQVERVQRVEAEDVVQLFLDDRPEGDVARLALQCGLRILEEEAEGEEVLAGLGELEGVLQRGGIPG